MRPWPSDARWARAAGALVVASAVIATAVARLVFPWGSVDNDEAIYRLQAQALSHGHAFLPAPTAVPTLRPWLAAVVGHHYVLKYTLLEPALLALGQLTLHSYLPVLAAVAGCFALVTWRFSATLLGRGRDAWFATMAITLSPLVVIQSGLLLAYLPVLVLVECFWWRAVVAGERAAGAAGRRGWWADAAGGLALSSALTVRPYDVLLLAVPVAVWALGRLGRARWRTLAAWLLGGIGPAVGLAVYDWAATGSVAQLPFNLLDRRDTVGFGTRALYPSAPSAHFGIGEGLAGVGQHLWLLAAWVAGGPLLIVLAVAGARRAGRGPLRAVVVSGTALVVGYVGFWGAWNASTVWHGVSMVGPFYVLPLVIPLGVLAGPVLARAAATVAGWLPTSAAPDGRARAGAAVVVAALLLVSAAISVPVLSRDRRASLADGAAVMLARHAPGSRAPGGALVLVASDAAFVDHPVSRLGNSWRIGGPVVFAAATGRGVDIDASRAFPERPAALLVLNGGYMPHPTKAGARLLELSLVAGPQVTVSIRRAAIEPDLRAVPSAGGLAAAPLIVGTGTDALACGLPDAATGTWTLRLTAGSGTTPAGAACGEETAVLGDRLELISGTDRISVPVRAAGHEVAVLAPGGTLAVTGKAPPPLRLGIRVAAA